MVMNSTRIREARQVTNEPLCSELASQSFRSPMDRQLIVGASAHRRSASSPAECQLTTGASERRLTRRAAALSRRLRDETRQMLLGLN
ncbi:hypothetical protein KIN20_013609 [Parelaphostrongylus tenuis]|uniref:Uncharacterized protein n=1 Tax=Parelaphostrongylus tenuis TaxID=148309 RepID=A0AAD5MFV2_PARTN|nr:hypothetical protein KIN20_013609 [Parelaphostrongylus tenuis]